MKLASTMKRKYVGGKRVDVQQLWSITMLIVDVVVQQWNDRSGADSDLEQYMQYLCSSTKVQRQVALSVRKCRHSGRSDDRGMAKCPGNYPSRFCHCVDRYVLIVQQLRLGMVS